jgi:hypothetical protein
VGQLLAHRSTEWQLSKAQMPQVNRVLYKISFSSFSDLLCLYSAFAYLQTKAKGSEIQETDRHTHDTLRVIAF